MKYFTNYWNKWRYKYLTALAISLLVAVSLATNQGFKDFLLHLGSMEYIGVLFAGILFVSSFTVAISVVIIGVLAQDLNPLAIGLIGGVGSVIGDMIIFRLVKDHLVQELGEFLGDKEKIHLRALIRSKYIAWTLPIIGALIIASPLPDELGVSLLGLSKVSDTKFIAISYVSNSVGILMIASVAKVI